MDITDRQLTGIARAEHLTVNDRDDTLEVDPRESLLDVLRERLDLTGTKKGCDQGACGACTVHVDGRRVLSCLTLAVRCAGRQVRRSRASPGRAGFIRCSERLSPATASKASASCPRQASHPRSRTPSTTPPDGGSATCRSAPRCSSEPALPNETTMSIQSLRRAT